MTKKNGVEKIFSAKTVKNVKAIFNLLCELNKNCEANRKMRYRFTVKNRYNEIRNF